MKYLTTRQAAELLGISPSSLQVRAARGEIPGAHRTYGNAGHWRFDAGEFAAYCADIKSGRSVSARRQRRNARTPVLPDSHLAEARARARAATKAKRQSP